MKHYASSISMANGSNRSRQRRGADQSGDRGCVRNGQTGAARRTSTVRSRPPAGPFRPFRRPAMAERIALIERIIAAFEARVDEIAAADGAARWASRSAPRRGRPARAAIEGRARPARAYDFETPHGRHDRATRTDRRLRTDLAVELAGPDAGHQDDPRRWLPGARWWLKPSEFTPVSAIQLTEVLREGRRAEGRVQPGERRRADVWAPPLRAIPISTWCRSRDRPARASRWAQAAARSVKRVSQELGGKSANIILRDADLEGRALEHPARLRQYRPILPRAEPHAGARKPGRRGSVSWQTKRSRSRLGDPQDPATTMGPVVNKAQFDRVQGYIQIGLEEGARLVCGGPGPPVGLHRGYFVQPTVFADVTPDMTIAREEIFGPVLTVIPYAPKKRPPRSPTTSPYGLGGYVFSVRPRERLELARSLRAGRVCFNGANQLLTPMGGYKQSGNGREMGVFGSRNISKSSRSTASRMRPRNSRVDLLSASPAATKETLKPCSRRSCTRRGRPLRAGRRSANSPSDGRDHRALGDLHLRLRSLALSRPAAARTARAHGPRVLRHRGRGRVGGPHHPAGPVRRGFLLHFGQHLPALSLRLPVLLRETGVHAGRPGTYARVPAG